MDELTDAEIQAMIFAAGITAVVDSPEYLVYAKYIAQAFNETAGPMADAEYAALLGVLQQAPPAAVLDAIRARAESNAKDLITNVTQAELSKIAGQIATATAEGRGPRDVARALEAVKGLDSNRAATYEKYVADLELSGLSDADIARRADAMYNKLLKDRKETIARTEMRKATSEVQDIEAKERGAQFKVWQTSGDDRVSDECEGCESDGPIPIDDNFSSGLPHPPNHPNCRCTVSYLTNPALLPEWQARADRRAVETAAAKAKSKDTGATE